MRLSLRISAEMAEHFSQSSPENITAAKRDNHYFRPSLPPGYRQGEGREKLEDYFPICFFIAQRLPVLVFS
jgi:hypothetical protein